MRVLGSVLMVLAVIYHAQAQDCQCGDGEGQPGMISCMKDHLKKKMEKRTEFFSNPPNCDDPSDEDTFICSKCQAEYDTAKPQLSQLKQEMSSCINPAELKEKIGSQVKECAKDAFIQGCQNPQEIPLIMRLIGEQMQKKCDLDDDEDEENNAGRLGPGQKLLAGMIKRKLGLSEDCDLKEKAREVKRKLMVKYPSLRGLHECIKRNRDEICEQKAARKAQVEEECFTTYNCGKNNMFGAVKNVFEQCRQSIDLNEIKETIKTKCLCVAKAAGIINPEEFCSC